MIVKRNYFFIMVEGNVGLIKKIINIKIAQLFASIYDRIKSFLMSTFMVCPEIYISLTLFEFSLFKLLF